MRVSWLVFNQLISSSGCLTLASSFFYRLGFNGIAKIGDFGVAHYFENEKDEAIRKSLVPLDDDSITELLTDDEGNDDNTKMPLDDSEKSSSRKERSTYLSKRESDEAVRMSSQYDSGFLNKTEGTWCYWSPEMCAVDGGKFSGYAADLWSAGVCLYVFTTGRLPFFSLIPSELFELIAKADIDYDKLHLSDELKDLLQMMLKKDPASRAGVGDALQHEFCSKARIQRVKQLGREFQQSDHNIILTNDDVDMVSG